MLYIMRHGLTDWNEKHKLQGKTDIPLNEQGIRMAKEAAKACQNVHFDVCYCSPLKRALQTAKIVLQGREIPILTDERLMEMSFGVYEGIENSFQIPDCPINVAFLEPEHYHEIPEGAESFEALFARTGEFLKTVIYPELESGRDILIVGHGAMNTSIVCQVRNIPIERFWSVGIDQCRLERLL